VVYFFHMTLGFGFLVLLLIVLYHGLCFI